MTTLLLNKPYGVLSQFTPEPNSRWRCLAEFIDVPKVYAAGRLDADSEGLLLLTSHGRLQQRLTDPRFGHWRSYWVQVEGVPQSEQLLALRNGVVIQGKPTRPARVRWLQGSEDPGLPERIPPIRVRVWTSSRCRSTTAKSSPLAVVSPVVTSSAKVVLQKRKF